MVIMNLQNYYQRWDSNMVHTYGILHIRDLTIMCGNAATKRKTDREEADNVFASFLCVLCKIMCFSIAKTHNQSCNIAISIIRRNHLVNRS